MKTLFSQKGSIGLMVLVIVLSVVILAGAVGGAWYYIKSQNANLKSQNDNEKLKINETETVDETTVVDGSSVEEATGTETTDATADWKTYTNEKYGFSFKYPEGWEINNYKPGGVAEFIISLNETNSNTFALYANPGGFGLEGLSDYYTVEVSDRILKIISKEQDNAVSAGGVSTGVFSYNPNQYIIAYYFNLSDRTNELKTFDQILSTFRFTK